MRDGHQSGIAIVHELVMAATNTDLIPPGPPQFPDEYLVFRQDMNTHDYTLRQAYQPGREWGQIEPELGQGAECMKCSRDSDASGG